MTSPKDRKNVAFQYVFFYVQWTNNDNEMCMQIYAIKKVEITFNCSIILLIIITNFAESEKI